VKIGSAAIAFAAFLSLAGCATTDAQKVSFSGQGQKALVLLALEPEPAPYILHMTPYDEAKQELNAGFLNSGDVLLKVEGSDKPTYIVRVLEPGTYTFSSLSQQRHWGVCFHNDTRSFTVAAGEAVFLGDFQPKRNLAQLEGLAAERDETQARRLQLITYFDDIVPPQITTPSPDSPDFLLAKQYVASSMKAFDGQLRPAIYKPAWFKTITEDLDGVHVCWSHD
jgi:hypothetical protein